MSEATDSFFPPAFKVQITTYLAAFKGMFRLKFLLRAAWHSLTRRLFISCILAPLVYALAAIYHIYLQAKVGGWDDMPGYFVQPDHYKEAGARWFAGAMFLFGSISFIRGMGFKMVKSAYRAVRVAPSGFRFGLESLKSGFMRPQVYERILVVSGMVAVAADLIVRFNWSLRKFLLFGFIIALLAALKQSHLQNQRISEKPDETAAMEDHLWLFLMAAAAGLLLSYLYYGFLALISLGAGIFFRYRRLHPNQGNKNGGGPGPSTIILLFSIFFLVSAIVPAIADDGGWPEYTPPQGEKKTIEGYLRTPDGQKVIELGKIAGWFAMFGAITGILGGGMLGEAFGESLRSSSSATAPVVPPPIPGDSGEVTPPFDGGTVPITDEFTATPPTIHRDGEVNEFGEVWSDEDRGWIGRNLYEEEKARRTRLADKAVTDLHSGQSDDVKEAYDQWLDSKANLEKIRQENLEAERLRRIEQKRAELEALEAESKKGVQTMDVVDTFTQGVEDTTRSGITDIASADVWRELGSSVKTDVGQLWDDLKEGVGKSETYLNAGKAVLQSAKGMAEGMAMVGKAGWHAFANPIDTTNMVLSAGGDPLAALEFVTRTADHMVGSIVDPKKRLSERLQGVAKLELEAVMGEGMGKALGAVGELKAVKNLMDKVDDLKTGIFGKAAETTGQRVYGTGQSLGREAEKAAMAKLPPGHPARKIGEINEAAAKAGPEFNSRLIKGDRLLDDTNAAYQKGIDALKTDPKYLTSESKKVADAVRYDQHLRAQQEAVKKMLGEHPELKGHLQGIENTGSHAWRRSDYKPGRSDIDINARGDGTSLGNKVEETFPDYYRKAVNDVSGGKLNADDLKSNCYGDGKAQGALKSQTGSDFVESYKASGKGRLDVFDNETGQFKHSLDGKDPLLNGDRKFFDASNPAEAAGKARDFHADVAAKHFEETANLQMAERLRQGAKNVKTIGNITGKLTGQTLPEPIAKLVKNAAAAEKWSPAAQQQALELLEGYLKQH